MRCRSQEYLFGNIIKGSVAEFIFSKIPSFQHILLNTLRQMHLQYENYSLRCMEISDTQRTLTLQKPHCKYFDGITIKMKAVRPI